MATVGMLDVDPELAAGIPREELATAQQALRAPALRLARGEWDASTLSGLSDVLLGAVVVSGRLQRTLTLGARSTAHLFGSGDIVRPWDDVEHGMAEDAAWQACVETELAVLDRRFVAAASRWPGVLIELSRRGARQTSRMQMQVAIAQLSRVDDRVLVLLWRLGQRWGRMTPAGVAVRLALTHATIARLVGATRPPVSTAIGELTRAGLVHRLPDGWLLDPSADERVAQLLSADEAGAARQSERLVAPSR